MLRPDLGIADLLKDGPKRSEELAEATGTHAPSLYRLLRALASRNVFEEDRAGRFRLTPLAELLQTEVPGSLRAAVVMRCQQWMWQSWGNLLHSVQTGETAFRHLYEMSHYEYLGQHPDLDANFNMAMAEIARHGVVAAAYNFSGMSRIIDVGGGYGALLAAILQANPSLRGILFDAPHVVAGAKVLGDGSFPGAMSGSTIRSFPCLAIARWQFLRIATARSSSQSVSTFERM